MKKHFIISASAIGLILALAFEAQAKAQGEWDQAENGRWMYCYQPGEPVKDEWIEDAGKVYYVDSSGYMKTGWVLNQQDGKRYYMGPDGAMCFHTFAPDGRYAGSDGSELKEYDAYRRKSLSSLKSAQSSKWYKSAEAQGRQPVFLFSDLNGDGYRDLVIKDGNGTDSRIMSVAVWDKEEKTLLAAAEFDLANSGDTAAGGSSIYLDADKQEVWLEIQGSDGSLQLFQMEDSSPRFEQRWSFTVEMDQWDGADYRVNGDSVTREEWEYERAYALAERGGLPLEGFLTFIEENITREVDRILTLEDQALWQS